MHAKFVIAISKNININPREGWIRASSVVGAESINEISRLSKENADLRKIISDLKSLENSDELEKLANLRSRLDQKMIDLCYRSKEKQGWSEYKPFDALVLFRVVAQDLIYDGRNSSLQTTIAIHAADNIEDIDLETV